MDFLLRAKLLMRKEWQEIWNCCDGNKLHAINPTVGVTKQNDPLSRREAVILNRLQIGHTQILQKLNFRTEYSAPAETIVAL